MTIANPVVQTTNTPEQKHNGIGPRAVDWENPRVTAILAAAAKCFAQKGFSATTLAEIGKELGLRKSIVHYYFASKSALIHEVQSFTYHRYLQQMREAVASNGAANRVTHALKSLWQAVQSNTTGTGLNIEVWSAARRDPELRTRASKLMRDSRQLIGETFAQALGNRPEHAAYVDALSTLTLAVVNGLSITEYLEGDAERARRAYDAFLRLLELGVQSTAQSSGN